MQFRGFPSVINLELTHACNLRCGHCNSAAGTPLPNEMGLDEILKICDQFPELQVREVDFVGGEPFLRLDWFRIALYLRSLEISVRVVSNGALLGDNVSHLENAGIAGVCIGLDGLEQTHDHFRQRSGLFRQVINGVEATVATDIDVTVVTIAHDDNVNELPQLYTFLRCLGVRRWRILPINFSIRRKENVKNLSTSSSFRLAEFIGSHVADDCRNEVDTAPPGSVGCSVELDTGTFFWQSCGAGMSSCTITADGKVKGCLSFPDHFVEGNLRQHDLWSICFDKRTFGYTLDCSLEDLVGNCSDCSFGRQCR